MDAPLRQAWLRDLHWLLASEPLVGDGLDQPPTAWLRARLEQSLPRLIAADADTDPTSPNARRFRIGRHAEDLLAWWLDKALVLRGHEVVVDGRTLGEIDLVFHDPERGLLHWEVAVKHFLVEREGDLPGDLLGPDAGQSLTAKVLHLRDHQLPLGRHPSVTARLGEEPVRSEALLRGWIFHPLASWQDDLLPSDLVHVHHPRGWWLRHGHDDIPVAARSSRFVLLDRNAWIAPILLGDEAPPPLALNQVRAALDRHFRDQHQACLIAEVQRDGHGCWAELARGFVLDPRWPTSPRRGLRGEGRSGDSAARSTRA